MRGPPPPPPPSPSCDQGDRALPQLTPTARGGRCGQQRRPEPSPPGREWPHLKARKPRPHARSRGARPHPGPPGRRGPRGAVGMSVGGRSRLPPEDVKAWAGRSRSRAQRWRGRGYVHGGSPPPPPAQRVSKRGSRARTRLPHVSPRMGGAGGAREERVSRNHCARPHCTPPPSSDGAAFTRNTRHGGPDMRVACAG